GDDLVARDDNRPVVASLARHLRVDEELLHLLPAARETIARPSCPDYETRHPTFEVARPELHRSVEPDVVVLAHRANTAAEIGGLRPFVGRDQLDERLLEPSRQPRTLVCEREEVPFGASVDAAKKRKRCVA